jgi:hypothetical protein
MDYLTPFHVDCDEFVNILIELLVDSQFCSYDVSFGSPYVGLLRGSRRCVLISHLLFSSSLYLMACF